MLRKQLCSVHDHAICRAEAQLWELWYSERGAEARELMFDGIILIEKGKLEPAAALFRLLCKQVLASY